MPTVISAAAYGQEDAQIELQNGPTPGRGVVVIGTQLRNPTDITGFTLDGVLGEVVAFDAVDPELGSDTLSLACVWDDANLPETPGAYAVNRVGSGGTRYAVIELSGMPDVEDIQALFDSYGSAEDPGPVPVPSVATFSAACDLMFIAYRQPGTGSTILGGEGQVSVDADNSVYLGYKLAAEGSTTISAEAVSGSAPAYGAWSAIGFPANIGPSVTAEDGLVPGEPTPVTPTNFASAPTGARITDGVSTIEIAYNSENDTVTPPMLGTQPYVLFGDVQLELYNSEESATTSSELTLPPSHQYLVTLGANPENLTKTGYLFNWSPDNGYDGGQILAPVPIDANGNVLETSVTGEQTFYAIDPSDGAMQGFPVTISEGGTVVPTKDYPTISDTDRLRINRIAIATKLSVLGDWVAIMQRRLGAIDEEIDELMG